MDYKDRFAKSKANIGNVWTKGTKAFFDGGCIQNPGGPISWGTVIYHEGKRHEFGDNFEAGTNNEAEYLGLILCLTKCVELKITEVEIFGDSKLVINTAEKTWKLKAENLKPLFEEVKSFREKLKFKCVWIPREQNFEADEICGTFLDYFRN